MIDFGSAKISRILRILSFTEGLSLLLLFFVAMPLKYMAGKPEMVSVVGMAHGLLFMALVALMIMVARACGWSRGFLAFALISSTLPFGMLVFDYRYRMMQGEKS